MVNFIESKTAPNPLQYKYWVDLTENPYGRVIKYYNGSKWIYINENLVEQDKELQKTINDIQNQLKNKADKSTTLSGYGITDAYTKYQTDTKVSEAISNIVGAAPDALDTLYEIAAALNNDEDFAASITTQLGNKLDKSVYNTDKATFATKTELNNKVDKVSGKQLSTNDYTTTEKQKLAGIADNANNYSHPTSAGNKHIPTGGSANQVLTWKANGEAQWSDAPSVTVGKATADALGGIKVGYTTSDKNYAVQLDSNDKAFVNVNWSDTKVTVNNTLTSDSTAEALSAAQGKQLKDLIDALTARVTALETPTA